MRSHTTQRFREAFRRLPERVQRQAREAYARFMANPRHPSLRFGQVHPNRPIYSARVTASYRAVGVLDGEDIVWFWIGPHAEYERLIATMSR